VATFHVVMHRSGPDYDRSLPLEQQSGWDEHAAFMDALVDEDKIILGGPLEDERFTMHVVEAGSEQAVRDLFATDPWWMNGMLRPVAIERWEIVLDSRA